MESLSEQAAQAARDNRGPDWYLVERLSEGEIPLPVNIPICLWILTMKRTQQGHLGYEIVIWNRTRFISIETQ